MNTKTKLINFNGRAYSLILILKCDVFIGTMIASQRIAYQNSE